MGAATPRVARFRREGVSGQVAAVGLPNTPIRWEKGPQRTARIGIFVVAPLRDAALYLQVVGAFARSLSAPDTALALLAAKQADEVMAVATLDAVEWPSHLMVRHPMTPPPLTLTPTPTPAH